MALKGPHYAARSQPTRADVLRKTPGAFGTCAKTGIGNRIDQHNFSKDAVTSVEKDQRYTELQQRIESMLAGEHNPITVMSTIASILKESFPDFY